MGRKLLKLRTASIISRAEDWIRLGVFPETIGTCLQNFSQRKLRVREEELP